MNGKRLAILAAIALLTFSGVLLLLNLVGVTSIGPFDKSVEVPTENLVEENMVEDNDYVIEDGPTVVLQTSSTVWTKDEVQELVVVYEEYPQWEPNAITVHLLYDPEYVEVTEVTKGDLWEETNVLQREIDNEKGEVVFSAGQNFFTEVTGNSTLANFKVKVIKSRALPVNTEFELGPKSAMTALGIGEKLILLNGLPVKIEIRN